MATDAKAAKPARPAARKTSASAAAEGNGKLGVADEKALEAIVATLTAARDGDFTVRLPARRRDVIGDVQARVNELVEMNARMAKELQRLARVVGRDGPDDRARRRCPASTAAGPTASRRSTRSSTTSSARPPRSAA